MEAWNKNSVCNLYQLFMCILSLSCPVFLRMCDFMFSDSSCWDHVFLSYLPLKKCIWGDSWGSNSLTKAQHRFSSARLDGNINTANATYITDLISFAIAKCYIIKIFKIEKNCHSALFSSKLNIFLSVVLLHHSGRRLYSVYAANKKYEYFWKVKGKLFNLEMKAYKYKDRIEIQNSDTVNC